MKSKKPTLFDVARQAGVSPATVSRAISRPELLKPATLTTIREVARSLGYIPDSKARALVSGRTGSIGVVVPTLDSPIFSRALQSMQRSLSIGGSQLLVASNDYDPLLEASAIRALVGHGIDGLVLVGADRPVETWNIIDDAGVPAVLMWCSAEGRNSISVDNERAGELIATHLMELGHTRFGIITGTLRTNDRQRARLRGVRRALERAHLTLPDWSVSEQTLSLVGGRAGCNALLSLAEPPTAIIGAIDILAIGAIIELQSKGLNVPADVSVGGIDNLEFAAQIAPSLTTVHIPSSEIGARAAARILEIVAGDETIQNDILSVEIVARRSTAHPHG